MTQWMNQNVQWVVNDLESKIWLKKQLVELKPLIETDQILRASELWQQFLFRADPQWNLVNSGFCPFLIENWLSEIEAISISAADSQKIYGTMEQLLPILSQYGGEEVMAQWFSEKPEAEDRWGVWYQLCQRLWELFKVKKVVPDTWAKALLVEDYPINVMENTFVFDLGFDVDHIESELILNLSRFNDVHVLVPSIAKDYGSYQVLLDRAPPELQAVSSSSELTQDIDFLKFPSMLSEVKEAVARSRTWVDQGIPAEQIAIVSPQIENYWPTLVSHLDCEGLLYQKAISTPLSQLPFYQQWLSRGRLAMKQLRQKDTEFLVFGSSDQPSISFSEFQQNFRQVLDQSDYQRVSSVEQTIPAAINADELMSLDQFFSWVGTWVKKNQFNGVVWLWQKLDGIAEFDPQLSFTQWIHFFEHYFARNEKTIIPALESGLHVTNLTGAHNLDVQKIIVIGLTEKNLSAGRETPLHLGDVESIRALFGFNLAHQDDNLEQDKLQWLADKPVSESVFTYSEHDFSGQFQSPALFWLQGTLATGDLKPMATPSMSRWDELSYAKDLGAETSAVAKRARQDLGVDSLDPIDFQNASLSASSVEEYFKCPFKYYARKRLKLDNNPFIDLDMDPMSRGRLLHRICELVVIEDLWASSDPDFDQLVERARHDVELEPYSDALWKHLKPAYLKLAADFVQTEKAWRSDYPATKTLYVEKALKTHLDVKDDQLVFSEKGRLFRGVIDRIDQAPDGSLMIIDYKSSGADLTQYGSWLTKGKVQLLIYALALREGLVTSQSEALAGTYFYNLKDMDRTKGLHIKTLPDDFIAKTRSAVDDGVLDELIEAASSLVKTTLGHLNDGIYSPQPENLSLCETCDWKSLCRAPHLNP